MNHIGTQEEFIDWLTYSDPEFEKNRYIRNNYRPKDEMLHLEGLELLNLTIRDKHFENTEFKQCKFENCDFTNTFFSSSTLENCHFQDCTFTWSKFIDVDLLTCQFEACTIIGLELSDAILKKTLFINCGEILDLAIRGSRERNVSFINCYLHHLDIEPINEDENERIDFLECLIKESSFDRIDFTTGAFENCNLSLNQFSSCQFSQNSFVGKNETPGNEFNLIDIRSLLKSESLDPLILEKLFGIHSPDVKDYLIGITSKIEFQSIFISYSFKDQKFAKRINEELMRRGILTFLWEKDSPGGKPLKKIMSEGVREKDRVLFIASKNSLKSEACHFELTEGRKKQEETWEDVLFPIHIDNFLFEVEKEAIRPIETQEEYWKNITELKDLNSLSFAEFLEEASPSHSEFDQQLLRLIKGLRKRNE